MPLQSPFAARQSPYHMAVGLIHHRKQHELPFPSPRGLDKSAAHKHAPRYQIKQNYVGIPNDLIEKYGVQEGCIHDPTKIIAGDEEEARTAIRNSVRDMAEIAGKYLSHARLHQGDVPNEGKSAMLPAVSALRYLDRLKGVNFDVFEEKIRDVENIESLNGRFWRFGHLLYLGRAQMTGVF